MEETTQEPTVLDEMKGAFVESLLRNNKKIRQDRAIQIAESAQILFKRKVEDLAIEIKSKKRERDAMLDLSPTTADSLTLAKDFDAGNFVNDDINLGVAIRNLEIKYEIAKERYTTLFGPLN
jgi:hypothetical protein